MDKRIVVAPIISGVPANLSIDVARAMVFGEAGKAIVLSIISVPEERSLSEGALLARTRRELLRRVGGDADTAPDVEFSVRAAHRFDEGVRETIREFGASILLLGWRGTLRSERRLRHSPLDSLILTPPCDIAVFKPGRPNRLISSPSTPAPPFGPVWPPKSILVPIRGGPHAHLSLTIARSLAKSLGAELTAIRIVPTDKTRTHHVAQTAHMPDTSGLRVMEVASESVAEAIIHESQNHQLLILGASARNERDTHLVGVLPERLGDRVSCHLMIVKTAERVSPEMFGTMPTELHSVSTERQASISSVVDQWFAENTFHSHEFEDLGAADSAQGTQQYLHQRGSPGPKRGSHDRKDHFDYQAAVHGRDRFG